MSTDPLPDHLHRPHVRPIQPLPVQRDGKQFVALRDPTMLAQHTMIVPAKVMQVLQQFQGKQTLEELARRFNGDIEQFVKLAEGLDKLGLLWGPTFERLESQRWEGLRSVGVFPARASRSLGAGPDECRSAIEDWFQQTEDPELEGTARAIVAPHLDYERGWPNYAAAYHALRSRASSADRVVVLGTNHHGMGDGVVLSELGFETPLGRVRADEEVVGRLVARLGSDVTADQLDHVPEHSIELQIPWIQYCFGDVPIIAALIPDPLQPMIDGEGSRVTVEPFVEALRGALDETGGRTFFVSSADLSHVGPQFGEPRPVDEQRRVDVERHDRDMMGKFLTGDPEEFLAAMRWNRNPTRWCSIGNMAALLMLTAPAQIELIDYRQAYDERGVAMVTSAAMAVC